MLRLRHNFCWLKHGHFFWFGFLMFIPHWMLPPFIPPCFPAFHPWGPGNPGRAAWRFGCKWRQSSHQGLGRCSAKGQAWHGPAAQRVPGADECQVSLGHWDLHIQEATGRRGGKVGLSQLEKMVWKSFFIASSFPITLYLSSLGKRDRIWIQTKPLEYLEQLFRWYWIP